MFKKTITATAVAVALAAPVYAELDGDLSLGYVSEYSFRGLSDSLGANQNGIGATANIGYSLSDEFRLVGSATAAGLPSAGVGQIDGHNLYSAGFQYQLEGFTFELGYMWQALYTDGSPAHTGEVYGRASTTCAVTGIDLSLLAAYDTQRLEGTYIELGAGKGYELTANVDVRLDAGISAAYNYWTESDGLNHAFITLSAPIAVTENLTLSPFISYTYAFSAIDNDYSKLLGGNVSEGEEFIYGLSASVKF